MSLNIFTSKELVKAHNLYMPVSNDAYFNALSSIPNTDFALDLLTGVEKAEYNTDSTFISRNSYLGALNKSMLSTGVKTAFNVICHPEKCFNIQECGSSVLKLLLSGLCDGNVYWDVPVLLISSRLGCDLYWVDVDKHYTRLINFFEDVREGIQYGSDIEEES